LSGDVETTISCGAITHLTEVNKDIIDELVAKGYKLIRFKDKAWLFLFAGALELIPLMEAIAVQLREVDIELELEEADVIATVTPRRGIGKPVATCGSARPPKKQWRRSSPCLTPARPRHTCSRPTKFTRCGKIFCK
jgi:hypothetical protein